MDICNEDNLPLPTNSTTGIISTNSITSTSAYIAIETCILVLMLVYIISLNVTGIVVTIGSAQLRGCLFSMQLAASYMGNMVAATSLIGNDIYFSQRGVIPLCQHGIDKFVLLYFGISLNLIILIMNTHYRYQRISSMIQMSLDQPVRTKDVVLKNWLPGLFVSSCTCGVAVVVQQTYGDYHHFLVSMGLCVIPLGIAIIWNVILSFILHKAQRGSMFVQREESMQVLQRATFIINAVIILHTMFLLSCIVANVCTLYLRRLDVAVGVCWFLRVLYFVLFTIEGHIYISKVKTARDFIRSKMMIRCCSSSPNNTTMQELLPVNVEVRKNTHST